MLREDGEDLLLIGCETDFLAAARNAAVFKVDDEVACFDT
ncbi:hypothetical protein BH09SUM1_BH09SUM1_00710 [soil metagenome]